MYICLDCCKTFSYPKRYVDTHGLDAPPYEEYDGCIYCGGAYTEAYKCSCCDEYITDRYVKLKTGERICECCYTVLELGEENG